MEDKIKFPANVILIDVAFLNEVVYGAQNFEAVKVRQIYQ